MANFYGSYIGYGTSATQAPGYIYQGENYGYNHGGATSPSGDSRVIERWSFASGTQNSTQTGLLTANGEYANGTHSGTHGYAQGVQSPTNMFEKYSFADGTQNGVDIADYSPHLSSGAGMSSETHGYIGGGYSYTGTVTVDKIYQHSFADDSQTGEIADMSESKLQSSDASDTVHGYLMCGASGASDRSTVEKYIFQSTTTSTDIGDMTEPGNSTGGASSTTHGYCFGRYKNASNTKHDYLDKFNFSGGFTATTVGTLGFSVRHAMTGASSTTHGYHAGGTDNATHYNDIGKVDFASDGDSTDVGSLTINKQYGGGTHF